MSDLFISYASEDRERIQTLVKALEGKGWSVWWDPEIPHGRDFRQVIDKALDAAKCVIVVWSSNSVLSQWVIDEADEGRRQKKLVPILIDDSEIPLGFRQVQTAKLIDWEGESNHPEFEKLLRSIGGILGQPRSDVADHGKKEPKPSPGNTRKWHTFAVVAVIILVAIVYKFSPDIKPPEIVYFGANPETIHRGETSILRWETSNAEHVMIRHGIGNVSPSGSTIVSPTETTNYILVASEEEGRTAEREVTVEVMDALPLATSVTNQELSSEKSVPPQKPPQPRRINLIASENGGHLVVASSGTADNWNYTINGDEGSWHYVDGEAVYAFKDVRSATFDTFRVLIPNTSALNLKEFELLVGNDSPVGQFESIGKFQTQNIRFFKDPYQEFKFTAVKAKYLKVKILSAWQFHVAGVYKFQLLGSLDDN